MSETELAKLRDIVSRGLPCPWQLVESALDRITAAEARVAKLEAELADIKRRGYVPDEQAVPFVPGPRHGTDFDD